MKRTWRVIGYYKSTFSEHEDELSVYGAWDRKENAIAQAEELARKTPGKKYLIAEIIGSRVVDGMAKEDV